MQTPDLHASEWVQDFPSVHEVPSGRLTLTQAPAALQLSCVQ